MNTPKAAKGQRACGKSGRDYREHPTEQSHDGAVIQEGADTATSGSTFCSGRQEEQSQACPDHGTGEESMLRA
jgi:hypothetical protein